MTAVVLAYPWGGHASDETVEVDRRTARRMVRDGLARYAPEPAEQHTEVLTRSPMFPPIDFEGDYHQEATR
jgi:hypothetical protein